MYSAETKQSVIPPQTEGKSNKTFNMSEGEREGRKNNRKVDFSFHKASNFQTSGV